MTELTQNPSELKAELISKFGENDVFDSDTLVENFRVMAFCAPFVSVVRKADNKPGSLEFIHRPRFYFDFREDK